MIIPERVKRRSAHPPQVRRIGLDKGTPHPDQHVKMHVRYTIRSGSPYHSRVTHRERDNAIADYVAAIQVRPRIFELHAYRALVLRAQGRIDQSIGEAKSLIAANPKDAHAYMIAGDIEAAAGNQTEAMHAFDRAVEITPDESTYLMRAAYRRGAERVGHNRQSRLCTSAP
jgi:Flp pilus assembly protein TadD